jgi:DNA-binding SARP family transcriptional activator
VTGSVALCLLGDFALVAGGKPVTVPSGGRRLLAFLGLGTGPVARSRAAAALWPDSAGPQASANLRAALSRLPRPGGTPLVVARQASLGLADHVQTDLRRCTDRVDNADLALLESDLLPFWDEDWVVIERERHRQARLHALEDRARDLLEASRFGEALQAALAAAAGEPLRESPHRLAVQAHLAEGNLSEALRQYDTYRALLQNELGLRPSKRLHDLVLPLLRGE